MAERQKVMERTRSTTTGTEKGAHLQAARIHYKYLYLACLGSWKLFCEWKDIGDATSVSLLNLDPSETTPEVSPQTQRRARASLSDISSLRDIEGLSVRQLKEILARNFVNYSGCCEKWELVERVSRLYRETEENRKSLENVSSTVTTDGEKGPLTIHDDNLCRICMDAMIDCVLLECGHMVTCTKCGKRMNECPICRQYVVRAVHVFKS